MGLNSSFKYKLKWNYISNSIWYFFHIYLPFHLGWTDIGDAMTFALKLDKIFDPEVKKKVVEEILKKIRD
jgi:hypothetical protein